MPCSIKSLNKRTDSVFQRIFQSSCATLPQMTFICKYIYVRYMYMCICVYRYLWKLPNNFSSCVIFFLHSILCSSHPFSRSCTNQIRVRVQKKSIRHGLVEDIFLMTVFRFHFGYAIFSFRNVHSDFYFGFFFAYSFWLSHLPTAIWNTNVSVTICVASRNKTAFYEHHFCNVTHIYTEWVREEESAQYVYLWAGTYLCRTRSFNGVL